MNKKVDDLLGNIHKDLDTLIDNLRRLHDIVNNAAPLEDCDRYSKESKILGRVNSRVDEVQDDLLELEPALGTIK